MKKLVFVISILVVAGMLIGALNAWLNWGLPSFILPASFLIFAFAWMPIFLFYAYDRRQRKKEEE